MTEPKVIPGDAGGLVYLLRAGEDPSVPPVIMLHGKGGDEKVMWVLEGVLPKGGLVASPRGLYPLSEGGYQWKESTNREWPSIMDFARAGEALLRMVDDLERRFGLDRDHLVLMGFSQGAALAFAGTALGMLHTAALVSLAGYVPEGDIHLLHGSKVFWGHGLQDDLISIERAREDVVRLRGVGANVDYCETDIGHKLGIECARGLNLWLSGQFSLS
ncbi:MAG: alpha/beta hydrolase [Candidatus Hodarchaeota archaeon]